MYEDKNKNVFGPYNICLNKRLTNLLHRIIQLSEILMVLLKSLHLEKNNDILSCYSDKDSLIWGNE